MSNLRPQTNLQSLFFVSAVLLCFFCCVSVSSVVSSDVGVRVSYWTNTGFGGSPAVTRVEPNFGINFPLPTNITSYGGPFSARVEGELLIPVHRFYVFTCSRVPDGVSLLLVWVDDHVVCSTNSNDQQFQLQAYPMSSERPYHIQLDLIQTDPTSQQPVQVFWDLIQSSQNLANPTLIDSEFLSPVLPSEREARNDLRNRLNNGRLNWWPLSRPDMGTFIHMPDGLGISVQIYQMSTGTLYTSFTVNYVKNSDETEIEMEGLDGIESVNSNRKIRQVAMGGKFDGFPPAGTRVPLGDGQAPPVTAGPHSATTTRPYTEFSIRFPDANVSVETTKLNDDLMIRVTSNVNDYLVVFLPQFHFSRIGHCHLPQFDSVRNDHHADDLPDLTCVGAGFDPISIFTGSANSSSINSDSNSHPHAHHLATIRRHLRSHLRQQIERRVKYSLSAPYYTDDQITALSESNLPPFLVVGLEADGEDVHQHKIRSPSSDVRSTGVSYSTFMTTGSRYNRTLISSILTKNLGLELSVYSQYGNWSEHYEAMHGIMVSNSYFDPHEGVITAISRVWNFGADYSIFEWDNYFGTYMQSWMTNRPASSKLTPEDDDILLDIMISNLIQVTKTRQPAAIGDDSSYFATFVPNLQSGADVTRTRSEPPVAGKVTADIWKQLTDGEDPKQQSPYLWVMDLLLEDMFNQNSFFFYSRRLNHRGPIVLGDGRSSRLSPIPQNAEEDCMQCARFESGLDNSPMYDGDFYSNFEMQMYDVGHTALFLLDCERLIELYEIWINQHELDTPVDAAEQAIRRQQKKTLEYRFQELSIAMESDLWNDEIGLYVNKRADANPPYFIDSFAPTSFYPLITGIPSVNHASDMLHRHLTNSSEFCVTHEQWDPVTNSTICRYGLPSIGRVFNGYYDQYYWRGPVWGPMVFINWWGLSRSEYDDVPNIDAVRHRYVQQAADVIMVEWRAKRHVHENFNHMTADGCHRLSDPYYTWGALTGFVGMLYQDQKKSQQPNTPTNTQKLVMKE